MLPSPSAWLDDSWLRFLLVDDSLNRNLNFWARAALESSKRKLSSTGDALIIVVEEVMSKRSWIFAEILKPHAKFDVGLVSRIEARQMFRGSLGRIQRFCPKSESRPDLVPMRWLGKLDCLVV